jgi:hypothetical protein
MTDFLYGAIAMAAGVITLGFMRFYRRTGDRFFLYFSASFGLECLSRVLFVLLQWREDDNKWFYLLRVVAYGLILAAIVDKNVRRAPAK